MLVWQPAHVDYATFIWRQHDKQPTIRLTVGVMSAVNLMAEYGRLTSIFILQQKGPDGEDKPDPGPESLEYRGIK